MVKSKHVPVGWPTVIPRIAVDDSEALVAFILHVFGAVGRFRWKRPSGTSISRSTCHSRMIAGATSFGRPAPASTASIRSGTPASLRRSSGPMCRGACRPDSWDAPLGPARSCPPDTHRSLGHGVRTRLVGSPAAGSSRNCYSIGPPYGAGSSQRALQDAHSTRMPAAPGS